jgi:hypothetical protein
MNPNSFQFNDDVKWDVMDGFSNTLATSALALPFNDFNDNPKNGTSYRLNYPVRMRARRGIAYDPNNMENIFRRFRNITLGNGMDLSIDGGYNSTFPITWDQVTFKDGVGSQEAFSNEFLVPCARSLGELINNDTMYEELAINFSDTIGDPSQPLNGINTMAAANTMFSNMGLTMYKKKYLQLSPNSTDALQTPYTNYFNQSFNASILEKDTTVFDKLYSGIMPYVDQSYVTVQNGVFDTGAAGDITVAVAPPLTQTANDPYSVITLTGFANNQTNVLRRLNRIQFRHVSGQAVQMVNPNNYKAFNNQKTFVVLGDNGSPSNPVINATGNDAEIRIFPPVITASSPSPSEQNVDSAIVVGDIVTLYGAASTLSTTSSYTLNFGFVDQAIRFANPPIGTTVIGSSNMGFGGFPFQQKMSEKIPNSELTISLNISSQGNHPEFNNVISSRAIAGTAAFNNYGFGYATSM